MIWYRWIWLCNQFSWTFLRIIVLIKLKYNIQSLFCTKEKLENIGNINHIYIIYHIIYIKNDHTIINMFQYLNLPLLCWMRLHGLLCIENDYLVLSVRFVCVVATIQTMPYLTPSGFPRWRIFGITIYVIRIVLIIFQTISNFAQWKQKKCYNKQTICDCHFVLV